MVRWSDGLYGGLIAGVTSAAFYAVVTVAWLHETTVAAFFAQIAQALPPFHTAPAAAPVVALGVVLHFLIAAAFGVLYAVVVRGQPSAWQAPTSVMWGTAFGLFLWWILNDVVAPVADVRTTPALWERLVGTVVCYGIVLSEWTTLAGRRQPAPAPAGAP
jgi:hypothetical protein